MNENKTFYEKLIAPFKYEEVNWRISNTFNKDFKTKTAKALVVPYIKKDVIQDRLDQVFGFDGWSNSYEKWGENAQLCGISIKLGSEIITKWDGAANSEIEAVKGGLSDSFKRAAKMLGIGRYIGKFGPVFLEVDLVGEKLNPSIRDVDLRTTLKNRYNKEVSIIFNKSDKKENSISIEPTNPIDPDSKKDLNINPITNKSLNTINSLLAQTNVNVNNVLKRYCVSSLNELSESNARNAIKILLDQKANIA